jgi:hypothetical protein
LQKYAESLAEEKQQLLEKIRNLENRVDEEGTSEKEEDTELQAAANEENSKMNMKQFIDDLSDGKNMSASFSTLQVFNRKNYMRKTNVRCWWDCETFNSYPIPLPSGIDKDTGEFKVFGCFCSFECAVAFNNCCKNKVSRDLIFKMYRLYQKMGVNSGVDTDLKPALARETLETFGGYLSIDEFRRLSATKNVMSKIYRIPFIPITYNGELTYYKKNTSMYSNEDDPSKLRLRRKNPLPNESQTLMRSLKIT